jgi:hypothetical protein
MNNQFLRSQKQTTCQTALLKANTPTEIISWVLFQYIKIMKRNGKKLLPMNHIKPDHLRLKPPNNENCTADTPNPVYSWVYAQITSITEIK